MWSLGSTNQLPNRHVRSNRFTQDYNHTALTLQKYRHGVIFAYFAFWDFSLNLNGTPVLVSTGPIPWVTQNANSEFLHLLLEDQIIACFFVKFLGTMIESDDCTIIESHKITLQNCQQMRTKHTIFLPEPSVHETLGATYVGPCTSYFSGTIPVENLFSSSSSSTESRDLEGSHETASPIFHHDWAPG